jgi:hypothetical protein
MGTARLIVLCVGIFFALIACVALFKLIGLAKLEWATARGTVQRFERKRYPSADLQPAYELNVEYSYEVAGRRYTGTRVEFDSLAVLSSSQIVAALGSVEPTEVTVYYQARNPGVSMLMKPNLVVRWSIFGALMLFAALCGLAVVRMKT